MGDYKRGKKKKVKSGKPKVRKPRIILLSESICRRGGVGNDIIGVGNIGMVGRQKRELREEVFPRGKAPKENWRTKKASSDEND